MPNYHKHWYGTLVQYNALASKDSNTLYHCSEGLIYRGSVLLATRRWGDLSGKPSTFAPSAHTHTKSQITDFPTTWAWASLTGVPSTFTPSAHTHDDRYYTETEVNTLLTNKSKWDNAYGWGNHASAGYALNSALTTHTGLTNNPHSVTKAQVGLGNVENTKLSTWAGSGSITALGTVVSGTWSASTISVTKGGTGKTSVAANNMLYATENNAYAEVATTSFGRGLLNAVSGTVVSGLNADTLDGKHGTGFDFGIKIGQGNTGSWFFIPIGRTSYSTSNTEIFDGDIFVRRGAGSAELEGSDGSPATSHYHVFAKNSGWAAGNAHSGYFIINAYHDLQYLNRVSFAKALYNGEEWFGFKFYQFQDCSVFMRGYGTGTPTAICYKTDYQTTTIKNQEISDSIVDISIPTSVNAPYYNGVKLALVTDNVASATILQTTRKINGVDFNGSANITVTANTTYTLTRGNYLTGSNFNGSANTTWAVDATSANTASKVVARDSNGDFACRVVNASSGVYSLKVVTGGHNYASQTYGLGIGTDGSNSGVIFYDGTGATGRIFRDSDVMRFIRGGLSYSGFDINADGSITVQGDMTTRTSLVVGSTNGTYVQIGSARLVYDQTNNAIKVVNADNSSCSLYATGSISAFGIGSSGGSSTSYSRLDDWADYVDGLTNDYVLSAELGYDLHTRVNSLNSFQSGTSWGGTYTGIAYLSIGGTSKSVSIPGHTHHFTTLTNKPTTLGGYGITNALPSTGGTINSSVFQMLELKRNTALGASIMFSNSERVLAKLGFDTYSSFIIGTGDTADGTPNMLYINAGTKQITGYGSLNVSGNIESGTADGSYIRAGLVKFLYDNSVTGIRLLKNAGGYAPFYAGSVYANEVQLTSSRSMKKDIMPFKNGLDLIKSINVVSYLYKQDSDDDDRKIGFIADDTDSWLSGKSKTKYNIGNTVGALIKAVQELEKKNQELEQKLLSITNNN